MQPPSVCIVILNWNGWQDTVECVESCRNLSSPNIRILVVDNGSTDGSESYLRERFPDIELVQTGKNLGFTGGNNIGIQHALNDKADYIILLNNDTIVDREFVTEMATIAETDPSIGMLCPKMYFYDRPDTLWYAGASFHPWLGWGRHRGYNARDIGQFDTVEETERPSGCALMVSSALCGKIGLLRDEYFCYCEDIDWGMRARNGNFKIVYVPTSKIWHKVSRSSGGSGTGISLYYFVRNMFMCLDKNKQLPFLLRYLRYGMVLITAFLSLFTLKLPKAIGMVQICRGAGHYFRGRFGEFGKTNINE